MAPDGLASVGEVLEEGSVRGRGDSSHDHWWGGRVIWCDGIYGTRRALVLILVWRWSGFLWLRGVDEAVGWVVG